MPISFDNLRVGHHYKLVNYGEITEFEVIDIRKDGDFKIKDLTTLEKYNLKDLIMFGKGKDYNLVEL
jgi:flagellar biosynthesis GTPase FlhF